jgi:hypothetical protein
VIYLYPATSRGASLWSMNPGTHRGSANHLERGSAGQRLPAHLCPVLEQLLLGVPDATASRRLNMSPRTFSRRVAELLELLGVATRFQGGVLAAQLGWTPAPDEGYQVPQVIAAERHLAVDQWIPARSSRSRFARPFICRYPPRNRYAVVLVVQSFRSGDETTPLYAIISSAQKVIRRQDGEGA